MSAPPTAFAPLRTPFCCTAPLITLFAFDAAIDAFVIIFAFDEDYFRRFSLLLMPFSPIFALSLTRLSDITLLLPHAFTPSARRPPLLLIAPACRYYASLADFSPTIRRLLPAQPTFRYVTFYATPPAIYDVYAIFTLLITPRYAIRTHYAAMLLYC